MNRYSAINAVSYADTHWNDGVGLCAEFTSRALRAGGASIPILAWVPTLLDALDVYPYDEYSLGDPIDVAARAGDVVFYSDAAGDDFCATTDSDQHNCGHVGLVTRGGADVSSILADFHNNAHYRAPIASLLGGSYSTLRVYHVAHAPMGD